LYAAELHKPLTETRWNEQHVRDAIRAIVAEADAAYDLASSPSAAEQSANGLIAAPA
jgi:hypothetical protein